MKRLKIVQTACALASLLMLAACTQDQLADSDVQNLPEGAYPLTFIATQGEVAASPQTRVSDYEVDGSHKSQWTTGDQIKIIVSEGGNDAQTTCTLDESGSITNYNPQLHWKTTQTSKINAWYSNIAGQATVTSNTVSLADQSNRLAYVLKADEKTGVNYKSGNIQLQFKHQLAKVRVKVMKGTYTGNLTVATVSVKGYTSCTITNGTVAGVSGNSLGDISMKASTYGSDTYWEANLVPGSNALSKVITINADDKTTTCTLTSDITLAAGNVYTYTVTVNAAGPTTYPAGNAIPEITDNGEYIIEGNGNQTTNGIVISGSPSVTLKNVNISSNLGIEIKSGSPTILIDGTNRLQSSKGSAIALTSENANVTIKGNGTNPTLTVTGGNYQAGIGGNNNSFGNIHIEGITLTANGHEAAPGIGSGLPAYSGQLKKSGWIYIKNCTVTASGKYDSYFSVSPAAIGNSSIAGGASLVQGDITIENTSLTKSKILETLTQLSGSHKIGNGTGGATNRGTIEIGTIKIIASDGTFTDNESGYIDN